MAEIVYGKKKVRSPVVGELFYPEDGGEAEGRIAGFGGPRGSGGRAGAVIAPHGAWDISGRIAGAAFSAAAGRSGVSRVVVLGPVHSRNENGIFLSDSDFFETPLGGLPVDRETGEALLSLGPPFELNDIPHLREHSLEVLLPFIKYYFSDASIVPILMGGSDPASISALAAALRKIFEPLMGRTLLAVSCNVSMNTNAAAALTQAEECVRLLLEKNSPRFTAGLGDGSLKPCGGALAAALLESGLLDPLEPALVSGPLIHAAGEENKTVYYGAVAYEKKRLRKGIAAR
jgi:AmmeMemoRadiSam system protein B